MQKTLIAATLAALAVASVASGAVVAGWSFEGLLSTHSSSAAGAADLGVLTAGTAATGSHVGSATVYSSPVGNGSLRSFSSNTWAVGDYYQFSMSTTGYQNISVSWDQTGSNTGPRDFNLFASVNGGAFTQIGVMVSILANAAPNAVWNSASGSAIYTSTFAAAGTNNATTVVYRIIQATTVSANGGVVAAGGTSRVDNFIVTGDLVPTPGAASLIGLGAVAALRRRR